MARPRPESSRLPADGEWPGLSSGDADGPWDGLPGAEGMPLLTASGVTWTRGEFFDRVAQVSAMVRASRLEPRGRFAVIATNEPLEFYVLLLALWRENVRVVLPNRDFFDGTRPFAFHAHLVALNQGRLEVTDNPAHVPVGMPEAGDTVVFSSGSTGTPKGILHAKAHFFQNARGTARRLPTGFRHSLTFLKPYLVSAVSHFLVHLRRGAHLHFLDFRDMEQVTALSRRDPELGVAGSPIHVTSSLAHLSGQARPALLFSSGDAIGGGAVANVFSRFPDTVYVSAYGLAEVAGRFFVNVMTGRDSLARLESLGEPLEHLEYALVERRMLVRGTSLFHGYVVDGAFRPADVWHDSGDVAVEEEGGLRLLGRSNEEVKVLGNKVHLKDLETRIKNLLEESRLVVVPGSHPAFGTYLAVVTHHQAALDRAGVVKRLRRDLRAHEMPHQYCVIDEFPFTQTMKIDRRRIAMHLPSLRLMP